LIPAIYIVEQPNDVLKLRLHARFGDALGHADEPFACKLANERSGSWPFQLALELPRWEKGVTRDKLKRSLLR
jgi:hypothetical protein